MEYKYTLDFQSVDHDILNTVEDVVKYFIDEILPYFFSDFEYEMSVIRKKGKEYMDITINKVTQYEDDLNAEEIIELMSDKAYEETGNEEYLQTEDTTWLQQELSRIWKEWKQKENVNMQFYKFVESKMYRVCLEDKSYICL